MKNGQKMEAWWVWVHDVPVPKLDLSQHRGGETCPCLDPNLIVFVCRCNAERLADISPPPPPPPQSQSEQHCTLDATATAPRLVEHWRRVCCYVSRVALFVCSQSSSPAAAWLYFLSFFLALQPETRPWTPASCRVEGWTRIAPLFAHCMRRSGWGSYWSNGNF